MDNIEYYEVSQFKDNRDWAVDDYKTMAIAGLIITVNKDHTPSWGGALWEVNYTTHEIKKLKQNYDTTG